MRVNLLKELNSLVIRQAVGERFFIATKYGIIISVSNFAALLKFLVINGYISAKVLEGVLSEYYDYDKAE